MLLTRETILQVLPVLTYLRNGRHCLSSYPYLWCRPSRQAWTYNVCHFTRTYGVARPAKRGQTMFVILPVLMVSPVPPSVDRQCLSSYPYLWCRPSRQAWTYNVCHLTRTYDVARPAKRGQTMFVILPVLMMSPVPSRLDTHCLSNYPYLWCRPYSSRPRGGDGYSGVW